MVRLPNLYLLLSVVLCSATTAALASAVHLQGDFGLNCRGTVIKTGYVLTARHCAGNEFTGGLWLAGSPKNRSTRIHISNRFFSEISNKSLEEDMAILEIDTGGLAPAKLVYLPDAKDEDSFKGKAVRCVGKGTPIDSKVNSARHRESGNKFRASMFIVANDAKVLAEGTSGSGVFDASGLLLGNIAGGVANDDTRPIHVNLISGEVGMEILRKAFVTDAAIDELFADPKPSTFAAAAEKKSQPPTPLPKVSGSSGVNTAPPSVLPKVSGTTGATVAAPATPSLPKVSGSTGTTPPPVASAGSTLPTVSGATGASSAAAGTPPSSSSEINSADFEKAILKISTRTTKVFESDARVCVLVLVAKNVGVTSAHCIDNLANPNIALRGEDHNRIKGYFHALSPDEIEVIAEYPDQPLPRGKDFVFIRFAKSYDDAKEIDWSCTKHSSPAHWYIASLNSVEQKRAFKVVGGAPVYIGYRDDVLLIQTHNPGIRRSANLFSANGKVIGVLAGCDEKRCQYTSLFSAYAKEAFARASK